MTSKELYLTVKDNPNASEWLKFAMWSADNRPVEDALGDVIFLNSFLEAKKDEE